LLTLVLSGCSNEPATAEDDTPIVIETEQSPLENSPTRTSSQNPSGIEAENEEAVQEFIREWDLPVSSEDRYPNIAYYPRTIPKDIPYDLPAPDGARLIGSVTGSWVEYMLIFKTSLSPEAVHEFYAQALKERGCVASPVNEGDGLPANPDSEFYKTYCYGDHEASLGVETKSLSVKRISTSIRLYLDTTSSATSCNADPNP
jgi:hypothetical protein